MRVADAEGTDGEHTARGGARPEERPPRPGLSQTPDGWSVRAPSREPSSSSSSSSASASASAPLHERAERRSRANLTPDSAACPAPRPAADRATPRPRARPARSGSSPRPGRDSRTVVAPDPDQSSRAPSCRSITDLRSARRRRPRRTHPFRSPSTLYCGTGGGAGCGAWPCPRRGSPAVGRRAPQPRRRSRCCRTSRRARQTSSWTPSRGGRSGAPRGEVPRLPSLDLLDRVLQPLVGVHDRGVPEPAHQVLATGGTRAGGGAGQASLLLPRRTSPMCVGTRRRRADATAAGSVSSVRRAVGARNLLRGVLCPCALGVVDPTLDPGGRCV